MKKVQLLIGSLAVTCNFGINYFYHHYRNLTKVDLLKEPLTSLNGVVAFDTLADLFYAAHKAECSHQKTEEVVSREDIENYILSMDTSGSLELLDKFMCAYVGTDWKDKQEEPGEA